MPKNSLSTVMKLLSLLTPFFLLVTSARAVPGPEPATGNITLHDPTLCKDNSGTYFLFSSGNGIEIRTSTDRTSWKFIGSVFPDGAPWTDDYTGKRNALWAPDCNIIDGKFYIYYAASKTGARKSAIFLATSSTGQPGSFDNKGVVTSTTESDDYNAIDPNLYRDGNNWYLSFGSFWTGIKLISLDPSTGFPKNQDITPLAKRTENNGAMEASTIFKHGNFYYLFTSWDHCCVGNNSTYNIRVGRSTKVNGGYTDKSGASLLNGGGTLVLGKHDAITGPGGEDLMTDGDDTLLIYHYYNATDKNFLGINRLDFSSGWPVVAA